MSDFRTTAIEMKRVGVGGIDSAGMAARVDADVAALVAATATLPRDIIIGLGANDAVIAVPPDQATFESNILAIATAYHTACPDANIWLTLCYRPDVQVWMDAVVNAGIEHLVATTNWLSVGVDERVVLDGLLVDAAHTDHAGHLVFAAAYAVLIR